LCDVAVMAEEALYGANFMALGFTPGMGSTAVLEEAFGAPLARQLLFTGAVMKGKELKASAVPIAHAIVPAAEVRRRAMRIAREIAAVPRDALLLLKASMTDARAAVIEPALAREQANHRMLFAHDELRRAIRENF